MIKTKLAALAAAIMLVGAIAEVQAGPLQDRINSGASIRLGFATEPPSAYPGENNEPLGYANTIAVETLKKMGYTNIEPVVTDWGGLIPGLIANRFDIVTGGLAITGARCGNIDFSLPIAKYGDAFIVAKGNPKGINNYKDVISKNGTLAVVVGSINVAAAKKEGVPDSQVMQVPSMTELLAAVKSGRADAAALTSFVAQAMARENSDKIEATDSNDLPDWTFGWLGLGFRFDDADFREAFDAKLKEYLGTPDMLAAVAKDGYLPDSLPSGDVTTDWVCKNR